MNLHHPHAVQVKAAWILLVILLIITENFASSSNSTQIIRNTTITSSSSSSNNNNIVSNGNTENLKTEADGDIIIETGKEDKKTSAFVKNLQSNTVALSSVVRRVNYKDRSRKLINTTLPFIHRTKEFALSGSSFVSGRVQNYIEHRRNASLQFYKVVGSLLGLILSLLITGPIGLNWWTDQCLKERVTSCASVLTGSMSIGFGVGRELGLVYNYLFVSRSSEWRKKWKK